MANLEFLLGILESEPAFVAWEDLLGTHQKALLLWQEMGFLDREPGVMPVPSCPHCGEGLPYLLGDRYRCSRCTSIVDRRHLLLWTFNVGAFLNWLADELHLRGEVRQIDATLWQLGTWEAHGHVRECFFRCRGPLSEAGTRRLAAYRSAVTFYGLSRASDREEPALFCVSLLEVLRLEDVLTVRDWTQLLEPRGNVRFDAQSGALWVGDAFLGEVPVGSKEFHFLLVLARHLDSFVSYADLKHFVLQQSGSSDSTEEATFCQNLKSRIKKKWIPGIDRLIATTNKGDGYRLRRHEEVSL